MRAGGYDAVVVGAGPNGLAAAVEIARHGRSVLLLEGSDRIGGGTRTEELTLPGHLHDVCSAIHPLGAGSPYLATLPLADHGLEWIQPEIPLSHPFLDGSAVALHRSVIDTAGQFGSDDGEAYERLFQPLVDRIEDLFDGILGPLIRLPRHPLLLARFGMAAVLPASLLVRRFHTRDAKALFGGMAAHSIMPLTRALTSAVGLTLTAAGHCFGWPLARGGSQSIADALAAHLADLGGEIRTGRPVRSMADLPPHRVVLFDTMPGALAAIASGQLGERRAGRLRKWRHGPGSYKVDLVVDSPIPWRDPISRRAGTVHLGGAFAEMQESEAAVWQGRMTDAPFTLVAQQSSFDDSRAPSGHHVVWAYCHVPAGWRGNAADAIERRIEAFAPGFRDTIVARSTMGPADLESHNPNYVGGDITGGPATIRQLLARPTLSPNPYRMAAGIYLCSSATPPGAGVHGMSGFHAARAALEHELR